MNEKNDMPNAVPESQPVTEVPVDPPETIKVSWGATDVDPVSTARPIRAIRVYSNVDQRQLRVMKTADAEDCLHIYIDVP